MKDKSNQYPYHRTGKPYICEDVRIVSERTGGDIDAVHLFEAGMLTLHFYRCNGSCERLFKTAFNIPTAAEPERQAQWLESKTRRLFILVK